MTQLLKKIRAWLAAFQPVKARSPFEAGGGFTYQNPKGVY